MKHFSALFLVAFGLVSFTSNPGFAVGGTVTLVKTGVVIDTSETGEDAEAKLNSSCHFSLTESGGVVTAALVPQNGMVYFPTVRKVSDDSSKGYARDEILDKNILGGRTVTGTIIVKWKTKRDGRIIASYSQWAGILGLNVVPTLSFTCELSH